MASAREIVSKLFFALDKKDYPTARRSLHDDLSFRGPFDTFDKADPYIEALKKLAPMVQRVDLKKMFEDGNDVCVLYDMITNTPVGTSFICEWFHVKGDRIDTIRVVFDARPFEAMFAKK